MKKTLLKSALLAIAGVALVAGNASAGMIYANSVDHYDSGGTWLASADGDKNDGARVDPDNALGAPGLSANDFLSLGLGGYAVFGFKYPFDTTAKVVEITWNNVDSNDHDEAAKVFVWSEAAGTPYDKNLTNTNWKDVGDLTNDGGQDSTISTIDLSLYSNLSPFVYLAVLDTSMTVFTNSTTKDGFDISSVAANVPEPATMMLFGAGLAGLAGLGRRRKK